MIQQEETPSCKVMKSSIGFTENTVKACSNAPVKGTTLGMTEKFPESVSTSNNPSISGDSCFWDYCILKRSLFSILISPVYLLFITKIVRKVLANAPQTPDHEEFYFMQL